MRLPAGLTFQNCPRVVAYALIAAVVSAGLLAADGAYRWYQDAEMQVAEPSAQPVPARSVEAAEPAAVETRPADSPTATPSTALAPDLAPALAQELAPEKVPDREVVGTAAPEAEQPATAVPNLAGVTIPIPAPRPISGTTNARAPEEAAPQRTESKSSPQTRPQQARRSPAKETTRERAAPRRPVQAARPPSPAANPNVYYERDSQLGFAPQLRARTCNPATGQMPMQCYYPREGREQFPAKPLD